MKEGATVLHILPTFPLRALEEREGVRGVPACSTKQLGTEGAEGETQMGKQPDVQSV